MTDIAVRASSPRPDTANFTLLLETREQYVTHHSEVAAARGLEPNNKSFVANNTETPVSNKRRIQKRLESWKKSIPSSKVLQQKLNAASLRRESALLETVRKVSNYTDGVTKRANGVSMRKLNESKALQEKITEKQTTTVGKKEILLNAVSAKIREDRDKVLMKKEAVVIRRANEHAALKKMLEVRKVHASENKDVMMKEIMSKIQLKFNQMSDSKRTSDTRVKQLEENLNRRLNSASENKDKVAKDMTASFEEMRNKRASAQINKLEAVQDLQGKLEDKHTQASTKRENLLRGRISQRSRGTKEQYSSKNSVLKLKELDNKIKQKQILAAENRENLAESIASKTREKMNKVSILQAQKTVTIEALQEKLEERQTLASAKKEILLKGVSEKSLLHKWRYSETSTQKLKAVEEKNNQKQILAAENKEKLVQAATVRLQEKMVKVSNIQAQKTATVKAIENKLEERQARASTTKAILLKGLSDMSSIRKERYSEASVQKVKSIETKTSQKQILAVENKDNLLLSAKSKIQAKMDKISNIQEQKVESVDALRVELEERQALASTKKKELLKNISEKPLAQKEKYANASAKKLKDMEEKLEKKQRHAAENKENFANNITTRIQAKMEKVSSVHTMKILSVEILQDKLFEKHALASTKKKSVLKSISQKPETLKERYSNTSSQKIEMLKDKLDQKHNVAAENKEKLAKNAALKLQHKNDKISSVQAQKVMTEEAHVARIKQKQAHASNNKRTLMIKGMSERSIGSMSHCSSLSVQEVHEQRVKVIEEKLEKKHSIAAENKEKAVQNITMKIQQRMNKVLGAKQNIEADKISKLKTLQDKIDMKHNIAVSTKENVLKNAVGTYSSKKEKIAIIAEAKQNSVQKLEAQNDAKMKAAALQKECIVAEIAEKSAQANQKKMLRLRNVQENHRQKTKILEVRHKTKLFTVAQKKKSILIDISTSMSFDSSKRAKELASQRDYLENEMRLKYEDKLRSAERRRNLMQELDNEKKEIVRTRRDNIRKMKMLQRRKNPLKSAQQEEVLPLGILNENLSLNSNLHEKNMGNVQEMRNTTLMVERSAIKSEQVNTESSGRQENDENKENDIEEVSENKVASSETQALESRRLEFRAQAAEEIRSAKEVKRAELMKLAEERNNARERKRIEEAKRLNIDKDMSYRTSSTGSIDSLDWLDGVSYADPFDESRNVLHDIKLKPSTTSADVEALKHATEDLARAIAACDVKLSDIQVMQSIILAEEAAQDGRDEFKTVERLPDLDSVTMSFSTTSSRSAPRRVGLGSRIGSFSKRNVPRITARITEVSKRARPQLVSRISAASKRTKGRLQAIKKAAGIIDQRRREERASVRLSDEICA